MPDFIRIHPKDNVAVALHTVPAGTVFEGVSAQTEIPQGHKMALSALESGDQVVKYGFSIGHATAAIAPGDWVHTHNMKTNLSGELEYVYEPGEVKRDKVDTDRTFMGYRRKNGDVGIRNDVWIVNTRMIADSVLKNFILNQKIRVGSEQLAQEKLNLLTKIS